MWPSGPSARWAGSPESTAEDAPDAPDEPQAYERPDAQHQPRRQFAALAAWLLVVFAAAALGAVGSREAPVICVQLALPPWAPHAGVFAWVSFATALTLSVWQRNPTAL